MPGTGFGILRKQIFARVSFVLSCAVTKLSQQEETSLISAEQRFTAGTAADLYQLPEQTW